MTNMVDHFVLKAKSVHRPKRLGRPEVVVLGLALMAISSSIFLYASAALTEQDTKQSQQRLEGNSGVLKALRTRVAEIEQSPKVDIPTPETIRASLVRFEDGHLIDQAAGQVPVILEIDRLRKDSGVILSEINFNPVEEKEVQPEGGSTIRRGGGKSLFPGLEMDFTVQGAYGDVRRFLIGLETSRTFLIVNSLELKSVEPSGSSARAGLGAAASTAQVITLGIKLVAYFERQKYEQG
jgi:hypothetical protein